MIVQGTKETATTATWLIGFSESGLTSRVTKQTPIHVSSEAKRANLVSRWHLNGSPSHPIGDWMPSEESSRSNR